MTPVHLKLREARTAAELTQEQLAEKVGVRRATIIDLESGKSRRLDFDLLDKLCQALDVEPGDLFARARAPRKGGSQR